MKTLRSAGAGLCLSLVFLLPANAGEIPGLPPALIPSIDRDFAFNLSNDFLGRGGSVDDFRTQQIIISAKLNDDWFALFDHSILTLTDSPTPGRIDQMSASLGYRLYESDRNILSVGGGIRSTGEFDGEPMQNGFHRLIGSNIDSLPYVSTSDTTATAWIDAGRYVRFGTMGNWAAAYWLRGGSLATSDGQWDNTVSALATLSKNDTEVWFGLRQDWRSGYDADAVQSATAQAEDDTAIVLGVRFGALVIETVQQLNNDASYGQIMLVSSGVRSANRSQARSNYAIDFGFLLPNVELQLSGKTQTQFLIGAESRWRESAFVELRYGEPQLGDVDSLFVDTLQVSAGLEWERPVVAGVNWLSYYGALGVGWRGEQLIREAPGLNEVSVSTGKAVVNGAAGLRFFASTLGNNWVYRLQLGINATLPIDDETVQLGGEQFTLQKPSLGVSLGMSFERR